MKRIHHFNFNTGQKAVYDDGDANPAEIQIHYEPITPEDTYPTCKQSMKSLAFKPKGFYNIGQLPL